MIGILIIFGFKKSLPPDLVNDPPTDLAEEQEDDNQRLIIPHMRNMKKRKDSVPND